MNLRIPEGRAEQCPLHAIAWSGHPKVVHFRIRDFTIMFGGKLGPWA